MALQVTENLRQAIKNSEISPTLIAKIDGYSTIFGNVAIRKYVRIGDPGLLIGDDWLIGGFSLLDNQAPYISFSQGTTTRITQKLDPSRGQGSSVSQMTLALIDYNREITELVSPGFQLTDVIGRRVTIFLGAQDTSWPEDYNVVFRGVIQDVEAAANVIYLNLANTDEKKRISALPRITAETGQAIDFKSVTFQDLQFKNREDIQNLVDVTYTPGGTAGSEIVTVGGGGYSIGVQIQNSVSTAAQIKKAIENHPGANQLVTIKITGNSSDAQVTGSATLGTDSVIDLVDASEFLLPADSMQTYAVIENELIRYAGKTSNQLTGVTRAQYDSIGAFHDIEKSVDQVVRITDNGINIALKLMLSNGPLFYAEGIAAKAFQYYSPTIYIDNTIFFDGIDLATDYGVSRGDKVTVTGEANPLNNVIDSIILEVGKTNYGSYVIVSDNLVDAATTTAVVKFKSQFNVLPIGFGMVPVEVDVEQHLYVRDTFLSTFNLDLFVKDITDGKGFLEKQVYLPMTCFSVPRKGRSSIVYTVGPMPTYEVVSLDKTTVQNPSQLKVKRSSNENFFNQVQFDYDYDPISGSYLTHKNFPKDVDTSQIPVGAKPFVVESQGLTTALGAEDTASRSADRWLRRYKNGAEFIKGVRAAFSVGYQLEIGDIVAVDYEQLQLADFGTGSRSGPIKLMEVMNKILDNKTGEVSVDLVNTTFGVGDRFGLISPSSKTLAGSTTTKVILEKSWSTKPFERESQKWFDYLNQEVIIHNEDWSIVYTTIIRGFDNNDPQGMSVDAMPGAPGSGWIIQCPDYPNTTEQNDLAFWKQRHAFFSPRVSVLVGVSTTRFTVAALDVSRFFVGSIIRVHNYTFTVDSPEVQVTEIIGNDILVNNSLGFIPSNLEYVDLIGFPDKQQSYRVV
jgi:hypothetical protein